MECARNLSILITGATDGLGQAVAEDFAGKGASVLLHGRDPGKGEEVLRRMSRATGNDRLNYANADLASLAEVDRLAATVEETMPRLDVLVNNAAVGAGPDPMLRQTSAEGFELRLAVNYLAPFLLTERLLPLILKTADEQGKARVLNISSSSQQPIDFDNVMLENWYHGARAYSRSKLALVMFTFDLAEDISESRATVNALAPASLMDTKMVREWPGVATASVEEGLKQVERLAVADCLEGVSGNFFDQGVPARAEEQAYDPEARRHLRELSLRWISSRHP